jgi:hypothetical protein
MLEAITEGNRKSIPLPLSGPVNIGRQFHLGIQKGEAGTGVLASQTLVGLGLARPCLGLPHRGPRPCFISASLPYTAPRS